MPDGRIYGPVRLLYLLKTAKPEPDGSKRLTLTLTGDDQILWDRTNATWLRGPCEVTVTKLGDEPYQVSVG